MTSIKTKQRIGTALYVIAIILMMVALFLTGSGTDDNHWRNYGYGALAVAGIYSLWLSKEKKRIEDGTEE